MSMTQLIYISRAEPRMPLADVIELAMHSETNNSKAGISGALLSVGDYFMQLLEGERSTVEQLFEKIKGDHRHTEVHQLIRKTVSKRLFPEWGMRLLDTESRVKLDLVRLQRLIEEFCIHRETGSRSVEARVLLNDFKRQLSEAA